MDPTMTYFKMCGHPKIQEHSHYELGDFVARPLPKDGKAIIVVGYNNQSYLNNQAQKLGYIWLARQDQIQELVDGNWIIAFESFDEWYFNKSYPGETYPNDVFKSMEQLWLAFYMYEKHSLIWNAQKEMWQKPI